MKITSIAIGFISAGLLCSQASALETDYAGNTALPLQENVGTARSAAMGSAVIAVPEGAASLLWNPAALSRMTCTEISLHHNSGLGETVQETAIMGTPLGKVRADGHGGELGGIAASFGYVNYGDFSGRDENGLQTGTYQSRDFSGSVGWGMELLPGLSAGISLKTYHTSLDNQGYSTFSTDVGLLWKILPALDLGLAHSNLNLNRDVGNSPLTEGWRVGAAWTVDKQLLLAAATELQNNDTKRIQLGAEYWFGNTDTKENVLALRAGYVVTYPNPELDGMNGMTFGFGYMITRSLVFDYAMLPTGDLGTSNRLSLTLKFNCPGKPKPPVVIVVVPQQAPKPVVIRSIILEDSHFDYDKSTLRPEGMNALRENIQLLKDNPNAMVNLEGHTSMKGTEEYNQALSERRADAVEAFLVKEGIAANRISSVGYGKLRPAAYEAKPNNINSAAAKSNMRVLFEITVK